MMADRLQEVEHQVRVERMEVPSSTSTYPIQIYCHAGTTCTAVWKIVADAGDGYKARVIRLCESHLSELTSTLGFLAKFQHRQ